MASYLFGGDGGICPTMQGQAADEEQQPLVSSKVAAVAPARLMQMVNLSTCITYPSDRGIP